MGKCLRDVADNSKRYNDTSDEKFPGAYKEGTKVIALMRDCKTWVVSEIYSVRMAQFFDEEIGTDFDANNLDALDEILVTEFPEEIIE